MSHSPYLNQWFEERKVKYCTDCDKFHLPGKHKKKKGADTPKNS